jgi:Methyltransferase domain
MDPLVVARVPTEVCLSTEIGTAENADINSHVEHRDATTTAATSKMRTTTYGGGVMLKHFERVVATILPVIQPHFVELPPEPSLDINVNSQSDSFRPEKRPNSPSLSIPQNENEWPFHTLPPAARVWGALPGQLSCQHRATRKEHQVRCLLRGIFALLSPPPPSTPQAPSTVDERETVTSNNNSPIYTIVDFGGGSGHLSIPLALLLAQKQSHCPEAAGSCRYRVVCVDLSARSLDLLHHKAWHCQQQVQDNATTHEGTKQTSTPLTSSLGSPQDYPNQLRPTAILNLYTFHGPAEAWYNTTTATNSNLECRRFDMAVALHLCGEATDVVLRLAGQQQPFPARIVVAPCCVGKLSHMTKNPYVYQATGSNARTIAYPQSLAFCQVLSVATTTSTACTTPSTMTNSNFANAKLQLQEDWNALAKAADYSNDTCGDAPVDSEWFCSPRHATRRTAKALVETDRQFFLQETYGYTTMLTRMQPWEATPKHDMVLAWWEPPPPSQVLSPLPSRTDTAWNMPSPLPPPLFPMIADVNYNADVAWASDFLLAGRPDHPVCTTSETNSPSPTDAILCQSASPTAPAHSVNSRRVEWTEQEEQDTRNVLAEFMASLPQQVNCTQCDDGNHHPHDVLIFPTRMGGRRRKLVHALAQEMGLAHWCLGKTHAEKTVAVAAKGRRRPHTTEPHDTSLF